MWFSGGIATCIAFVALRGELAHLSKVMEARQEHVSAERIASGVFLVFFKLITSEGIHLVSLRIQVVALALVINWSEIV